MEEIGGYIELDTYGNKEYHDTAIPLNCGRRALSYLIEAKKINKLYLPYFCCDSVASSGRQLGTDIEYYHTDPSFRPIFNTTLKENEWLYIVNYYGQISNTEIDDYKKKYVNIIVDNSQSFFQMPAEGVDTLYTCRKFFGVPDGAYLYTDSRIQRTLCTDVSFQRMKYILGRFEKSASEFYSDASENNKLFKNEPIKYMSKLTHNLMRGIDYSQTKKVRTENFSFLNDRLSSINKLDISVPVGAFMYPLYLENGKAIRRKLQDSKIYIPVLWPDVLNICSNDTVEYDYAENILPLPVDQRYRIDTMQKIVDNILTIRKENKYD